jgi:U4/U6 small nuclear ribonucleoprotein PRP31
MDPDLLNDLEDLEGDLIIKETQEESSDSEAMVETDQALLDSIKKAKDVRTVAKLYHSKQLKDILDNLNYYTNSPNVLLRTDGPIEEDPQYKLIVQANDLTSEIDHEMNIIDKVNIIYSLSSLFKIIMMFGFQNYIH